MALRVVGAGLGRTGTLSLKSALERLLGAPCYHMMEIFSHHEHIAPWHSAARGDMPVWDDLLAGYAAAVDWPASAFWPELAEAYPDAVVLLSSRDPLAWWESANETIFRGMRTDPPSEPKFFAEWRAMIDDLFASRFTSAISDADACMAAFEKHNAQVRASVPAERLLEWQASDGWAPICDALELPLPSEPFPRSNTREEWKARGRPPSLD